MDARKREIERRRRHMQRVRQRNRRVALFVGLVCLIICVGVVNIVKNKAEKKAQEAYAKQQEAKAKEEEKANKTKITMAEESEKSQWYLQLVNAKNPMAEDEVPEVELKTIDDDGRTIDARIYDDFQDMMKDAKEAGKNPMVRSAFRKWSHQTALYQNKIKRVMNEKGLDEESAAIEAATVVARPGASEHQIGLALDIVSSEYTNLDEDQMKTEDQKWLMENSWKYGFILRYPLNKTEVTGVIFEPWHYRYVGKKAAKEITEQGITLEEYLGAEPVGYPEV